MAYDEVEAPNIFVAEAPTGNRVSTLMTEEDLGKFYLHR